MKCCPPVFLYFEHSWPSHRNMKIMNITSNVNSGLLWQQIASLVSYKPLQQEPDVKSLESYADNMKRIKIQGEKTCLNIFTVTVDTGYSFTQQNIFVWDKKCMFKTTKNPLQEGKVSFCDVKY